MHAGQFVGWSSSFIDYDNDGDVDIFKTNGALKHLYGQEDQLFENIGDRKFKDVSVERSKYFEEEHVGRGACMGDYDNDGDIDIYIVNLNNRGMFLRNNKGNQNNWLILNLIGTIKQQGWNRFESKINCRRKSTDSPEKKHNRLSFPK